MASSTGLDAAAKIAAELDAKAALIEGEEGGATYLSTPQAAACRASMEASTPSSALSIPPTPRPHPAVLDLEELEKALEARLSLWSNSTQKKFPR